MKALTIFTPTYNRAHLLPRLYESLCNQTCQDFEWIVVDDGSSDNTQEIIQQFIEQQIICIRYYKQPNGGKCRAINNGVKNAEGYLFMIVDSDDFLADGGVIMRIKSHLEFLKSNEDFCAIVGNKNYETGRVIGSICEYTLIDSDFISYREKRRMNGDKAEVIKTAVMRAFPFPEFEGETFMAEGVVWNRMALRYKARYINEPFVICEYQADGLTAQLSLCRTKSPQAFMLYYSEYCALKQARAINKTKRSIAYWAVVFKVKAVDCQGSKFMISNYWFTFPLGWLLHKIKAI